MNTKSVIWQSMCVMVGGHILSLLKLRINRNLWKQTFELILCGCSFKVAERIAQLQEALLHCGKFQDALEPLLSWLSDTEELIANQKPPSAEYRVVKAQIQEQKVRFYQ